MWKKDIKVNILKTYQFCCYDFQLCKTIKILWNSFQKYENLLKFMILNKNNKLEEKINARQVKNFLCTFFSFWFHILYCCVDQDKTKAEKLKILINDDDADLLSFLKNTHDNHDY